MGPPERGPAPRRSAPGAVSREELANHDDVRDVNDINVELGDDETHVSFTR